VFNEVADIAQFDLMNSRTFKDLWNEIQGFSSTCPVFKYLHITKALNLGEKNSSTFKDFQGCVGTLHYMNSSVYFSLLVSQSHYIKIL